jgi:uncharacterized coiled-coil DUF342 family protein
MCAVLPIVRAYPRWSDSRMEAQAQQEVDDKSVSSYGRSRHCYEQRKLLRLEVQTLMEQINILEQEMEEDPCLSTGAIDSILAQIDALAEELVKASLRIRELEASSVA